MTQTKILLTIKSKIQALKLHFLRRQRHPYLQTRKCKSAHLKLSQPSLIKILTRAKTSKIPSTTTI